MRQIAEPYEKKYVRFPDADIRKVADTCHTWQREGHTDTYADVPELCKSVPVNGAGVVKEKGLSLEPGKCIEIVNRYETVDYENRMRELHPNYLASFAKKLTPRRSS